jgi:AGZA family xanthine/uracil permease-like MFS transporter
MLVLGVFGLLGILSALIPVQSILPILIYIGLLITSQAFNASPKRHAPAVAIAILPWIADYLKTQIDNSLSAAGTNAATLGMDALKGAGVSYGGISVLGAGAILVGLILGAIAAMVIDHNWKGAILFSLFGAVCSWFGFIHSTALRLIPTVGESGFNAAWGPFIGYMAMALLFLLMKFYLKDKPKPTFTE